MQPFLCLLSIAFLIIVSNGNVITKLRLNKTAIDHLGCPMVTNMVKAKLQKAAIISWQSVSDDSVSKINLDLPPLDMHCSHEMIPSDGVIRFFLTWPMVGLEDLQLETVLDLAWKNGSVTVVCNSRITANPKVKVKFEGAQLSMDICKEFEEYITKMPLFVAYPIIDGLSVLYTIISVDITSDALIISMVTSLGSMQSEGEPRFIATESISQSRMIHFAFDHNLINMILDAIYANSTDQTYHLTPQNSPALRPDCGYPMQTIQTWTCLGSFMKSIQPSEFQNLDIQITSKPQIETTDSTLLLGTNGAVMVTTDALNNTLIKANFRLKARLNPNVTADKRILASISIKDLALMMSEFQTGERSQLSKSDTRLFTQLLAPILVDLINEAFAKGLHLPLPQIATLIEPTVAVGDGKIEVACNV